MIKYKVHYFLLSFLTLALACCSFVTQPTCSKLGTIGDCILSIDNYTFNEENYAAFTARVRKAEGIYRASKSYLYIDGDGTMPAREFFLDREKCALKVKDMADHSRCVFLYVDGKWVKQL